MSMKILSLILVLCLAASATAADQGKKKVTVRTLTKQAVKQMPEKALESKIRQQVVEPSPVAPQIREVSQPTSDQDDENMSKTDSLREDMNAAVKDLKNQLDAVKKDNSDAKLSGEIFFQYSNEKGSTKSTFDVARAYVTLKQKTSTGGLLRVTLDVGRLDSSAITQSTSAPYGVSAIGTDPSKKSQSLYGFLKYAYLEQNVDVPQFIPWNLTVKLGLQHTMWIDFVDKVWESRYIGKVFLDDTGMMSSADFGIGATGKFNLVNLPLMSWVPEVEYHATVMNGAGYKATDSNSQKDMSLRLNAEVYKDDNIGSVVVGAWGSMTDYFSGLTTNRKMAGAMVALKNEGCGNVFAEYMKGTKIAGSSAGGFVYPFGIVNNFAAMPEVLKNIGVIGRFDWYKPDTTVNGNDAYYYIMGTYYKANENLKIAYDMQSRFTGTGA